jgi:hypothetical protein
MIGRRQLFGATAGALLVAHSVRSEMAEAAEALQPFMPPANAYLPRGTDGRLARLGTLNLESQQDFTLGFRLMHSKALRKASHAAFDRVLEREGIDPLTPLSPQEVRQLVENEPAINIASKAWLANQQVTWKTLQDHFHANADHYLSEMEAADNSGPGKLELAPKMHVPEYARHEIHIQPGGYVGDPFAGHILHQRHWSQRARPSSQGDRGPITLARGRQGSAHPRYGLRHWSNDRRPQRTFPGRGSLGCGCGRTYGAIRTHALTSTRYRCELCAAPRRRYRLPGWLF